MSVIGGGRDHSSLQLCANSVYGERQSDNDHQRNQPTPILAHAEKDTFFGSGIHLLAWKANAPDQKARQESSGCLALDVSERHPITGEKSPRNAAATHKVRQARNLTVEQFQALLKELPEPFETLALCCATMGLRISEALGLRWGDVDWLGSRINIERAIVAQHVDATKTQGSKKTISIALELLERLRLWKQCSQFRSDTDWVFAPQ